jgi:hypothetical protein
LHELLKDVFKEENQVHLVQGGDEWEESEEAWEVDGEGEALIVGTVQREDDGSWQNASKSWLEQDEEEEDGTYHVGTCQGAISLPPEAREKQCSAVVCPPKEEDEDAETVEDSWWTPGPEDMQIERGEKEYFIELLMEGSAPSEGAAEKPTMVGSKAGQPTKKGATRGSKPASGRGKRKNSEKTPKGGNGVSAGPEKEEANARHEWGPTESQPGNQGRVVPPDLSSDPGAENGRLQARVQPEVRPRAQVMMTS